MGKIMVIAMLVGEDAALDLVARKVELQEPRILVLRAVCYDDAQRYLTQHGENIRIVVFVNEVDHAHGVLLELSRRLAQSLPNARLYADTGNINLDHQLVTECGCIESLGSRSTIHHIVRVAQGLMAVPLAELKPA